MSNRHIPLVRFNQHEEDLEGLRDFSAQPGAVGVGTTSGVAGAERSGLGSGMLQRPFSPGTTPRPRADYHHEQEAIACDGLHPALC